MVLILLFVLLFVLLVIHEEYNDFDRESSAIRKDYIIKQKKSIKFDINKVLNYIAYKYSNRDKQLSEEAQKKHIISAIEQLYGREDGTGYIFIYNNQGVKLSDPIQSQNIGENLYKFKDSNGVQVIKELIDASQKDNGGYVKYRWLKPNTGLMTDKISYAQSFKPWGWMIGTGVYLDEVEKHITTQKAALKDRLIKFMMEILSLGVILIGLGFVFLSIVNRIIAKEIDTFSQFFKKASEKNTRIDREEIHLEEFKKLVVYINSMVEKIHQRKNELKKLNLSLEHKVEEKTKNIAQQNKLLAQEKEFSESIIQAQDSFIKHSIHEINTPLAVIMTHIDIYKMKYGDNRYLNKIEAASKMIANIYEDLSYMVKKNRMEYAPEWINLSLFLRERIHFFEEIASGNHHLIQAHIEDNINILFNDLELQRIIDNNLSNSIKYSKKDSVIDVILTSDGDTIAMKFITHSKMIKDIDQIFEAFHREDEIKTGFGLGLEIVKSICKKEGVKIEVNSNDTITEFIYRFVRQYS